MENTHFKTKIENIRTEVKLLKNRLENIDKVLVIQEKALRLLNENTKSLFIEALGSKSNLNSTEGVMKTAFSKGKLPKILFS